jgi:ankyrin repeat protein
MEDTKALIKACTQGSVQSVQALLAASSSTTCVNAEGFEFDESAPLDEELRRRTPLMAAAEAGHIGVVGLLLDASANVEQGKSDDDARCSVLDRVIKGLGLGLGLGLGCSV